MRRVASGSKGGGVRMNTEPLMDLPVRATRTLFFTGKGGVGKTSLACATAIAMADRGRKVLLVSTDPASNLDEVLGTALSRTPRPVAGVPGLHALNIDPAAAAQAYREKLIAPLRGLLPDSALRSMEEQLSGACTMEIAAFDEFAKLLGDASATREYDHVVFDTAPTGHTLRLMLLPRAWSQFLDANTTGTSCLGPLAGLDAQRQVYERAMAVLADGALTTVVLVSRAQTAALREAQRSSGELRQVGICNQHLVLNGLFKASVAGDEVARALEARGREALLEFQDFVAALPHYEVPLKPVNLVGLPALRALLAPGEETVAETLPVTLPAGLLSPKDLLDELARSGRGVVMTMGKGGVGKTTVAAALAVSLAERGHPVHLSTTDPAAHVVGTLAESHPGITVSRIDPARETQAYVEQVMAAQGPALDAQGRALLEEDLRSPCTEEIAVFRAFARVVAAGKDGFVILDTAPTGHTLLLLDATEAYHRELGRQARETQASEVRELLPRLRNPEFTKVLLVTLPEATPVHEAAALQADLRRAGIEPFGWIINQSHALSASRDPLLLRRASTEVGYFEEVLRHHASRTTAIPWYPTEPIGLGPLGQLFSSRSTTTSTISMNTYVYETIPSKPDQAPQYFELRQGEDDAPLTKHPVTGEPIRRVVIAGHGALGSKSEDATKGAKSKGGCGCGPKGCC